MHEQDPVDFIEVIHNAVPSEVCAAIVERMRAARGLQPGAVGSGVFPELKHSKDLRISGLDGWQDVDHQLQHAVFNGLLTYLRRYPQALIAPLMLQIQDSNGQPRRLSAEDFPDMPQQQLADLARTCLRPGAINLQWYAAGEGGYPYWHCELYPKDAQAETLHRHVLWTLYLNDEFEEGETEFLFQGRKIAPRTGSLLIAPTAFTHTHRGNRPQGGGQVHRDELDPVPERAEVVWGTVRSSYSSRLEPISRQVRYAVGGLPGLRRAVVVAAPVRVPVGSSIELHRTASCRQLYRACQAILAEDHQSVMALPFVFLQSPPLLCGLFDEESGDLLWIRFEFGVEDGPQERDLR